MKSKSLVLLTLTTLLFADVPEHISFNSMVFDNGDNPLANSTISIKIELLDSTNVVLYTETNASVPTDDKGLISLKIGTQTTTDNFSSLDFDKAQSIRISRDLNAGTNYTTVATKELSTIPFAFTCKELSGYNTSATGSETQAWGQYTSASGNYSTAWGSINRASALYATAWGLGTRASGDASTTWGEDTNASGQYATAFGYLTNASGEYATAFGYITNASDQLTTAFGYRTNASGQFATAWGSESNSSGYGATAWGEKTHANGALATAFGSNTHANGALATTFGSNTYANGNYSTAFGYSTYANGNAVTAWGSETNASANYATASGYYTVADQEFMTAIGKYNTTKNIGALFVVGNGFGESFRSDAFEVMNDGNVYISGSTNVTSDSRLKTNITPVKNALEKLSAINGVTYNWINPNKDQSLQMGVVAQEVQAVMPELINERNDGYLSVNYSGMSGVLIEAIKEQQKELDVKTKTIEILRTEIENIKTAIIDAGISLKE